MYSVSVRFGLALSVTIAAQLVKAMEVAAQWQIDALAGHVFTSYDAAATLPAGSPSQVLTYEQRDDAPPFAIGARVRRIINERWGVEASLIYDRADVLMHEHDGSGLPPAFRESGAIIYLNAKGLAQLGQLFDGVRVHLGAGPALVWRSGDPFDDYSGTQDLGLVIGTGARLRLGGVHLRVDVEDHIYRIQLDRDDGAFFPAETQNDVLLSLGVTLYQGPSKPQTVD